MINFRNIGKHSYGWDFLVPYLRFAMGGVYFKELVIDGQENIPPAGTPLYVICNHQNSLIDPLVLLLMFKDNRQPVFLARGDVFKKDILAKIFRFFRTMPTFRAQDGSKSDLLKNKETFDIAAEILRNGGAIVMFPEAGHQQGRYLASFKKGFPRVCFGAQEAVDYQLDLHILPVNLHFSNIRNFREKVLIQVGKPFKMDHFFETYKTEPNRAFIEFNNYSREKLKTLVIDIKNDENYDATNFLRDIIGKERVKQLKKRNYFDQFKEEKKVVTEIEQLKENDIEAFTTLISDTNQYSDLLKEQNYRDALVSKKINLLGLVFQSLMLIVCFPFFLFGIINNGLHCYLADKLTKKLKDKVFIGSIQFVSGFLLFPFWFSGICIAASFYFHSFLAGLAYTILAFISLFVYFRYTVYTIKTWHSWRFFSKRKTEKIKQLGELRAKILNFFA